MVCTFLYLQVILSIWGMLLLPRPAPAAFSPPATYGVGFQPRALVLADVNGDGHPDLLTNHYSYQQGAQGRVQVRLGRPEGGWNPPTTYSVGTHSAERFAVADLNGDSRPDLVTLNRNTSTVLLADRRP